MKTIVIRVGKKTTLKEVIDKINSCNKHIKINVFQYGSVNHLIITYLQSKFKNYGWLPLVFYHQKNSFFLFRFKKFNANENIFFDYMQHRIDNPKCSSLQR